MKNNQSQEKSLDPKYSFLKFRFWTVTSNKNLTSNSPLYGQIFNKHFEGQFLKVPKYEFFFKSALLALLQIQPPCTAHKLYPTKNYSTGHKAFWPNLSLSPSKCMVNGGKISYSPSALRRLDYKYPSKILIYKQVDSDKKNVTTIYQRRAYKLGFCLAKLRSTL